MKPFILLLFVGCHFSGGLMAQSADIDAIKQLNEEWIHNSVAGDPAVWRRIFADDFVLINPAGQKRTKADIINMPTQSVITAKVDTAEVQIHGNIGLIHARCSFTMRTDGKETAGQTDYLDVYEKRNGRWWAIAAHVTYLGDH